jgi:hypothetical protein
MKWDKDVGAKSGEFELYNIIGDPSETQDLIKHKPALAARMRKQLDAWNRSVDRSITGADYPEGKVLPSGRKQMKWGKKP